MNPLISIIVPIYKSELYLRECVDSILTQTYKNIEIILVNDGSPDNCGKICNEYAEKDKRVTVIHKENGGVSSARNCGLEIANGEYIQFVDSDDYINENMTETLLNAMLKNDVDLVMCGHKIIDSEKLIKEIMFFDGRNFQNIHEFEKMFAYYYKVAAAHSPWNKLYKREICTKFNEKVHFSEDLVFNLEYIPNCKKISVISDCLYNYRCDNESATRAYRKNILEENLFAIDLTENFYINTFSSTFDVNEMYFAFLIRIKKSLCHYAIHDKRSRKKIKKGMQDSRIIEIMNKSKKKPDNINDRLLFFFIKYKMSFSFITFTRLKEKLKNISPMIFLFMKKIFAKRK